MAYSYTLPNATNGIDSVMVQMSSGFPSFIPLMLVFVYLLIFIGGFNAQRRREGNVDVQQWAVLASIGTLMVTLLLSTLEGLMNTTILSAVVAITILTGIWFFFSRGKFE